MRKSTQAILPMHSALTACLAKPVPCQQQASPVRCRSMSKLSNSRLALRSNEFLDSSRNSSAGTAANSGNGSNGNSSLERERTRSVTSYYNQSAIDAAAKKNSVRLTPASLLYSGRATDENYVLRSAQYLQKELPVRIAHRIDDFRSLPFIIGCNPTILSVHELYIRAFHILSDYPTVTNLAEEEQYSGVVRQLLDDHKDVVTMLAEGFRECSRHIRDPHLVRQFLDKTLTSRLGIRLLCEHHLALRQERPDFVGVVCTRFCPGDLIDSRAAHVAKLCQMKYGLAPAVKINGNRKAAFSYIIQPVEYIVTEVLKNAFRATVEHNRAKVGSLPEVTITVANNDVDFIIRFSDRGGGIAHDIATSIFEYHFSTSGKHSDENESFFDRVSESRSVGPMHGFGFGLPTSRAYAHYLGGRLTFETMQGVGSDFYLRLRHIDGKGDSFRI
ncbi:hypothetical protein BOX15_Mlig003650g2 [Macrostomum lignano]|uniref:Uncharacterized protein n=2 Tax=Macrostomum lignano TaxID=282301 RepID=A0A267G6F5_9PLAT|nr:hypothetical protein BOX15_Mlig003650g3 [Macrostomum lignano]PAA81610.1 hypothetical protein BOX15_Mlig003650g2 [Macrostomum lignano]